MIRKPRFKADLRVRVIPPDLLVLEGERGHSAFRGRLFPSLSPLLDGRRTVPEIVDALEDEAEVLDVHFGLTLLHQEGVLVDGDDGRPPAQVAFGDLLGLGPDTHVARLDRAAVGVRSLGASPDALRAALEEVGVPIVEDGHLEVVVVDDYLRDELEELNARALDLERPWMPVRVIGAAAWVGPIFAPGESACWACLARRLRQNRPLREFVKIHGGAAAGERVSTHPPLPSIERVASGLAATWVLRWFLSEESGERAGLTGELITIDPRTLAVDRHPVARLSDCDACGGSGGRGDGSGVPLRLESRAKLFTTDGGYRTVLPETTLERYERHVSPLTGIVDGIRRVRDDSFLQVFMSAYAFSPRLKERAFIEQGLRGRATGKGMHATQARASALSEALERYSGVFRGDEPTRRARFADLGDAAVHPNECMRFSAAQYVRRDEWNARERDFNWVPEPFDEDRPIEWTPVWSLSEERVRYVATAYCYYGFSVTEGRDLCRADSNGNAAGNTLEEAILQGFMEVVERDCVALWWYNRARRPAVDLDSFGQPYFTALRERYRTLGRELWVVDITSDLGVPAVAAVSTEGTGTRLDELTVGFGAHFDPAIAVSRALTEMNQFLPSALAGRTLRVASAELPDGTFLRPDDAQRPRRRDDYPHVWNADLLDDVRACVRVAGERDLEVLVLDQTRPDVGMPVVKVIVPGMYPLWARFAPGRLYTVPVDLGWVSTPSLEGDLNPAHLKI